ncbi:hypothetical protein Back11_28170 [Paenibacillus baekrokdamisoli]|uniref:Uncharacterized protein n=1 Tax=Paenibacillus baekrokdamisoli TaxID=1712516 RepID=A0A3G9IT90_9BACL|nr:hypothetical protein [Paenibacillus baekrokdamisoli]MBB3071055.1 hypothetical protein [Paenibacillus baekrokdamisoli]BBH21472.1 hypothetical protein Back11_28170 [Paenibacillus baekrokdamisoli]
MSNFMLFLHVIGAAGMGFYIVLPVIIGRASKLDGSGQAGLADGLVAANRIAQYFLVLQLLTGGYLISQGEYKVVWMIVVTLLFLAIAALGGIVSKPLKLIATSIQSGTSASSHIAKARVLSIIILLIYLVIIYFMKFPIYK